MTVYNQNTYPFHPPRTDGKKKKQPRVLTQQRRVDFDPTDSGMMDRIRSVVDRECSICDMDSVTAKILRKTIRRELKLNKSHEEGDFVKRCVIEWNQKNDEEDAASDNPNDDDCSDNGDNTSAARSPANHGDQDDDEISVAVSSNNEYDNSNQHREGIEPGNGEAP